jgi:putative membrane protein
VSRLVPGIEWQGGLLYLLLTGAVIGAINVVVKPIVTLLSIPFIILTLGLFYLLINGAMLLLASSLLQGLTVEGCLPAILGGLVLGLFNWVISAIGKDD